MTDYQPLLARALKGLERNTSEARRSVYDRARQALLNQLRSASPPMADADITRERLALEDAIRKTETEAVLAEPHAVRATPAARMPLSSRIATPSAASPLARPMRPAPPERMPAEMAPEPEPEAPPSQEPPAPPPPPPSPGLTLPPSLLSASGARGAPVSKEAPPARPVARPPVPPRARPPMPASEARSERESPPENARPRNGHARRNPLDELSQELEPRQAASARRSERPRAPIHDEAAREARAENSAPPPGRPRMARPSGPGQRPGQRPGPGMPPPSAKLRPQAGSNRSKILIAGTAVLLIAITGVLAYTFRGRIGDTSAPQAPAADADQPKSSERVAQSPGEGKTSAPTNLDPAVAQRAVLYEENPGGGQQFQNFVGTAVWKTEAVTGSGRAPELGLRIEIEIPDRHIGVVLKMRKNNDPSFPASHTIEILFTVPAGDAFGGVTDMRGIRAKAGETAQGNPIAAEVQKVKEGYFLLALPTIEETSNLAMLRDRDWIDIPFVYANGRRAVLTFQKGTPGERAVREVFMSWGNTGGG